MQVSITYEGPPAQRHVVKATAMAPLSSLLAEACSKMKPPLDPAHAGLVFNKKALTDLACPFRLANIPNGSSLTLTYSKPASYAVPAAAVAPVAAPPASKSGAAALPPAAAPPPPQPQTSSPPSAAPAAAQAYPAAPASAPAAATLASAAPSPSPTGPAPASHPAAQPAPPSPSPPAPEARPQATLNAAPALATDATTTATHQPQPMEVDQESGAVGGGATAAPPAAAAVPVPCGDGSSAGEVLGLGRPAVLFSRQALEEALGAAAGPGPSSSAASGGGAATADDEYDAFFEMTPEDVAAMVRANEARKKQEEAGLRTRALREAEERSRAEQYRHVAIRLHLPGGAILQATFAATETVGTLRALAAGVLAPQLAPAAYLYTTPPRTVLKGDSDSLYHCGLVPAAHVHVGLDEKKAGGYSGPALRPEAEALVLSAIGPEVAVLHPPRQQHSHVGGQDEGRVRKAAGGGGGGGGASGSGQGGAGGSAGPAGRGSGGAAGAAKVPKWLKLGGK